MKTTVRFVQPNVANEARGFETLCFIGLLMFTGLSVLAADPLPSWNETAPKKSTVAFVEKVTRDLEEAK